VVAKLGNNPLALENIIQSTRLLSIMLHKLIDAISKTVSLTKENIQNCETYFEPLAVPRNTILEVQGKIPTHLYFVVEGYIRLVYNDQNGEEQTTFFGTPNNFVSSFLSFVNQIPATESVVCVTDVEVFRIAHTNLKFLVDTQENFKSFGVIVFQQAITAYSQRANDLAALSAEQRYKKLMKQAPILLQNIPLQYIASYLGIKPESLSRIRRNFIS
jgi:CRP-like cAMP-binding protein